jgi:hypothetical protein
MNVETGTEAAQFPENEYTNRIFVAVRCAEMEVGREKGADLLTQDM